MNFLLHSTKQLANTWRKTSLLVALSLPFFLAHGQQGILNTRVSIQLKNQTIAQALEIIEEKTGYSFVYSPNLIDATRKVTVDLQNARLENILKELLGDDIRRVETKGSQINLQPSAGKGNLRGKILSSDGHPAAYVTISFAGRQIQADENGAFEFNTIEVGDYPI